MLPEIMVTRHMEYFEQKTECEDDSLLPLKLLIKPRKGFLTISCSTCSSMEERAASYLKTDEGTHRGHEPKTLTICHSPAWLILILFSHILYGVALSINSSIKSQVSALVGGFPSLERLWCYESLY